MVALVLSLTIRQFVGHFMGVILFLSLCNRKMLGKFVLIAIIGLPFASPIIIKNIENVKKNDGGYVGDTVRNQAYKFMNQFLKEKPVFGVGPGRYGGFVSISSNSPVYGIVAFDFLNQELSSLDAYYPQVLGELGYMGGILFFGFLATVYLTSMSATRKCHPPAVRGLAIAVAIATPMGAFDAIVSPFYENTFAALLLYTQIGVLCGQRAYLKEGRQSGG
ncbi:MAG: hypothetical protein AAF514_24415 [Verrucomicrobiota bacterium]